MRLTVLFLPLCVVTAISSAMVLSVEEDRVFVGAASPFFYGLDSATGRVLWFKESEEKDVFEVEAKVSPDDMRVYAIDVRPPVPACTVLNYLQMRPFLFCFSHGPLPTPTLLGSSFFEQSTVRRHRIFVRSGYW